MFEAFRVLQEEGGQLPGKEIIDRLRSRLSFTDWEQEIYPKTGYVRWESMLHFFSVDSTKAGFLRKNKGIWYLTPEGEKALILGPVKLFETASAAYKQWLAETKSKKAGDGAADEQELTTGDQFQQANLDNLEAQALAGIKEHIVGKDAYAFQGMVAALLRAMGYFTPFVAPRGKDGGMDIVAYRDPLGTQAPRIKVQVKHKPNTAIPVDDIRSLKGIINRDGEVGLFVTSGRFTADAESFARATDVHIRLIDLGSFVELWQEFYPKLSDEDKNHLPLHPVYFLGSNE